MPMIKWQNYRNNQNNLEIRGKNYKEIQANKYNF